MGRKHLQKIKRPGTSIDQRIPQAIIPATPDNPCVSTLDESLLVVRGRGRDQVNAAIHIAEVVFIGSWKCVGSSAGEERFILYMPWPRMMKPPDGVGYDADDNQREDDDQESGKQMTSLFSQGAILQSLVAMN